MPGGDVILAGVHVQRLGQIIQQEQAERERKMGISQFVAEQTGYNGDLDNVNGKDTYNQAVGKDGQMKDRDNANSNPTSLKEKETKNSKADDWEV